MWATHRAGKRECYYEQIQCRMHAIFNCRFAAWQKKKKITAEISAPTANRCHFNSEPYNFEWRRRQTPKLHKQKKKKKTQLLLWFFDKLRISLKNVSMESEMKTNIAHQTWWQCRAEQYPPEKLPSCRLFLHKQRPFGTLQNACILARQCIKNIALNVNWRKPEIQI